MKKIKLNHTESDSVKKSLGNIYALFLSKETIKPQYLTCIIKWGLQLRLNFEEVNNIIEHVDKNNFNMPSDKVESIEWVFDLVHLICLDDKIEDIELEVATIYAEALGYQPHVVGDILKSILTAPYDGLSDDEIREEIKNMVESNFT